jgi:hypothetical protein
MKRPLATFACLAFTVLPSACGEDESEPGAGGPDRANLKVRFTHPREHVVRYRCSSEPRGALPRCDRRKLARLASALRDHGRDDRACAELYGGPQRAIVTGTLRGRRVSARFTRVDSCAIADYDKLLRALGRPPTAGPGNVAVPDRDATPPSATIVLARADDLGTLAEASQPPGQAGTETVELREPRLIGTALAEDGDGGIARVRVSIRERITCRSADRARSTRLRTRYFPPPQIERIRATPGTRLPATRKRSLRLSLAGGRCGPDGEAVEIHGELWGEAINGSGLEAVTPHVRFVYRR